MSQNEFEKFISDLTQRGLIMSYNSLGMHIPLYTYHLVKYLDGTKIMLKIFESIPNNGDMLYSEVYEKVLQDLMVRKEKGE